MRILLILTVIVSLITGCTNNKQQKSCKETATEQPAIDSHNARNSLDYHGTYKGTLPCTDCQGIVTELTLNSDDSFLLKTAYFGKSDTFVKSGTYDWNSEGNIIILDGIEDAPAKYLVQENRIIQLDMSGNRVSGEQADKYVLNKL